MAGGVRCVAIDRELERRDPPACAFLLQFARDNQLKMRPGRKAGRLPGRRRTVQSPIRKIRACGPATISLPSVGRPETDDYAIALTAADRRLL